MDIFPGVCFHLVALKGISVADLKNDCGSCLFRLFVPAKLQTEMVKLEADGLLSYTMSFFRTKPGEVL